MTAWIVAHPIWAVIWAFAAGQFFSAPTAGLLQWIVQKIIQHRKDVKYTTY